MLRLTILGCGPSPGLRPARRRRVGGAPRHRAFECRAMTARHDDSPTLKAFAGRLSEREGVFRPEPRASRRGEDRRARSGRSPHLVRLAGCGGGTSICHQCRSTAVSERGLDHEL